jgi:two-component system, NarL family, nitrate/nitrite response regulator NarL
MHRQPKIAIVSQSEIRREGLRKILEEQSFAIHGAAQSYDELEPLTVEEDYIPIVIIEAECDEESLAICRTLHDRWPEWRIVILAHGVESRLVAEAFQAGTYGYISHEISCASLTEVLKLISLGEKLIPSQVIFDLANLASQSTVSDEEARLEDVNLSNREIEILRSLIRGEPNKIISRQLAITEATVKVHVKSILRKLNVMNRTQAAIWAMSRGLTSNPPRTSNGVTHPAIALEHQPRIALESDALRLI